MSCGLRTSLATNKDFIYFSPIGDCDFQNSLCKWYNNHIGDNFDWTQKSGATPSPNTGPTRDRKGMSDGKK